MGSAKDAIGGGVDAASAVDLSGLRDEVGKLAQQVSDLAQNELAAGRRQVVKAMGGASDNWAQTATTAQDKFAAVENAWNSPIKKNPWGAVAIAALAGLLIGKMS